MSPTRWIRSPTSISPPRGALAGPSRSAIFAPHRPPANAFVPQGLVGWLMDKTQAEQRRFGSAVHMLLTDGAIYRVIMTQSGLNAESLNPIAWAAVARCL